jgi:hypothetical protein
VPTTARKKHWIGTGGPWGTGLLTLSLAAIVIGAGYIGRPRHDVPEALRALAIPVWVLGALWIAAGIYGTWKALRPPQHHRDVWPFAGLTFLWSAAYVARWIIEAAYGDWTTTWTGAVVWAAFGGLVISWGGRCVNPPQR